MRELALLDTRLEGLVEERVELRLGGNVELVVGLNVFLDGLTADNVLVTALMDDGEMTGLPAAVALLELKEKTR